MSIGVIGYGRFGKLAVRLIARSHRVRVYDRRRRYADLPGRARASSLQAVARSDVILLAVPVSALQTTLRAIAPYVRAHAFVADVCAVKEKPLEWMMEILPRSVTVLGTHPLFGPDSVTRTLRGLNIVLCPGRVASRDMQRVRKALRNIGLHATIMSPAHHDQLISQTILLTQYVGRIISAARLPRRPGITPTYDRLLAMVETAECDSEELFRDMWKYNRFSASMEKALGEGKRRVAAMRR
jgi:prephenate dehydrogenase